MDADTGRQLVLTRVSVLAPALRIHTHAYTHTHAHPCLQHRDTHIHLCLQHAHTCTPVSTACVPPWQNRDPVKVQKFGRQVPGLPGPLTRGPSCQKDGCWREKQAGKSVIAGHALVPDVSNHFFLPISGQKPASCLWALEAAMRAEETFQPGTEAHVMEVSWRCCLPWHFPPRCAPWQA